MTPTNRTKLSKFLSYVLRHKPDAIAVTLDPAGWLDVDVLLAQSETHGEPFSLDDLQGVVTTNDKQRFEFSPDNSMIRARQGHSVPVALGYPPAVPPEFLYHGTPTKNLGSIGATGLQKGRRHHVHLSEDIQMTMKVAQRYGIPALITIHAQSAHAAGLIFHCTGNKVWLTDHVPAQFLTLP